MTETISFDDGFGLRIDDEFVRNVPLIGFGEDDGDDDDLVAAAAPPPSGGIAAVVAARSAAAEELGHGDIAAVRRPLLATLGARAVAGRLRAFAEIGGNLVGWFGALWRSPVRGRRLRAALYLCLAVAVSAGSFIAMQRFLVVPRIVPKPPPMAAAPPPAATESVLVARDAIAPGHILRAADLRWQAWPKSLIARADIVMGTRSLQDFVGWVARTPIAAGEPVGTSKIASPGEAGFLAAMLPPGMRAMSITISPETAVSGLILPGDRVDVALSLAISGSGPHGSGSGGGALHSTETVLRNIKVLAIDQRLAVPPGQAAVGHAATLEVTPKQAEILTLADFMAIEDGKLTLTLRSLAGSPAAPVDGASSREAPTYTVERDVSKLLPKQGPAAAGSGGDREPLTVFHGSIVGRPVPAASRS